MAKCEICSKNVTFSKQVSHSHRRSTRTWKPNLRTVKVLENGNRRKMSVCAKCLRSGKVNRAV